MELEYKDRQCVGCQKVHVNSLLMDMPDKKDGVFIMCRSCAYAVYDYLKLIKEAKQ